MKFIVGVIVGVLLVPLIGFCYFALGMVPVATSAPPMPFEKRLARMALAKRIDKEAPQTPPAGVQANEATYGAGAQIYRDNCAVCHGLPAAPKTHIAAGMYPRPPQLMHGTGVSDDPPGETYWKVENGIRLTGMPAFKGALSEEQIWQVTLLLANSEKLPDSAKQALAAPTK